MKNSKISVNFKNYSDANFLTKSEHIQFSMAGNLSLPDPTPTLLVLNSAVGDYSDALIAAKGGGKVPVSLKNEARAALEQVLFQLGMYVMLVANGDETILISSGFTLIKNPVPDYVTSLGNVTLANGVTSGQMIAKVKRQRVIKSYLFQLATVLPTEDTVWETNASSRSKFVFKDLVPGKQYWIKVTGIASKGMEVSSNVATLFAQ